MIHELFEKKGIDYDVRDCHGALVQKLLSEIDVDTIKVGNRTIEVDRDGGSLRYKNIPISTGHVHMLCRKHNISWRELKKSTLTIQKVSRTLLELTAEILEGGHSIPSGKIWKTDIIAIAERYEIPLTKTVKKGVTERWVGKPKGMLQLAYERGLLDLENICISDFSEKGKQNKAGNVIEGTSLEMLLLSCTDLIEEESLLQMNVRKMGAICFPSPKYHCEIAGEGIEYSWGNSKCKYRRIKASDKRYKKDFLVRVKECLSRDFLDTKRVRKNSRRAREYMVAYFILSLEQQNGNKGQSVFDLNEMKPCAVPMSKIEQMKQRVRCHRAAFDFDTKFCKVTINHVNEEVECIDHKNTKPMKIEKK